MALVVGRGLVRFIIHFILMQWVLCEDKIKALFDWVEANSDGDLISRNVSIGTFLKGGHPVRGLQAARDFKEGEAVIAVPEKLWFYRTTTATEHIKDARCQFLWLSVERKNGKDSKWAPFIEALPTAEEYALYFPGYAEPEMLESYGKFPPAVEALMEQKSQRKHWERCKKTDLATGRSLTFEDFHWAATVWGTRSWTADNDNAVMVPLAELSNTGNEDEHNVYWPGMVSYEMLASRDLKKGEELITWYASTHNSYYFNTYGLVIENNPYKIPATQKLCVPRTNAKIELPIQHTLERLRKEHCDEDSTSQQEL